MPNQGQVDYILPQPRWNLKIEAEKVKTMVTLRKLMDEVEDQTIDAETTLIDTQGIAVLNEDYPIHPQEPGLEDQEENQQLTR